ncbi:Cobalt/zinc/cadmium efflux RND transporter, membrane fusion protein, CzcB family [hydrothermal vent metagenome]|uniref:Cobalt/zinc/cadmium efflux RND transporter, membrane fusion protein, CzcB family n=1 Tax=hydrothermal vent metagenome TaxID=652676 RepID=A0A3B0VAE9_9ZZZZ
MNKAIIALIIGVAAGIALTILTKSVWMSTATEMTTETTASQEKKPLYWVAPMDPNYRRDKPGQSPMGMDLIPFYADAGGGVDEGPGTIRISPDVVNNLGVRTATAQMRSLHSEIKTVGYVKYDEDQMVHIHPRVEGWIEKLYIKASGDRVEQGQALYEIYSPALVNAQEELVLALDRKNKRLISAAKDRLHALQLPNSAIKNLIKTRKVKQNIAFYAPQSGFVDNLNIRQGFFVKPGTTIMSIAKLDQVWVEAEVFERQAAQVKVGTPVTMTLEFAPGKTWQGKVDYIYPKLDAKTRTLRVRLRFENKDLVLKPNMFTQVVIHIRTMEQLLLIPKQAVIRSGRSNRVVLALGEGKYKSIEVEIGIRDDNHVQVLSGLEVGETIVTSAQFLLDSESSKTSDFKRMNHESEDSDFQDEPPTATTTGVINSLMVGHGMLNISRDAIEAWGRDAATVDFISSKDVDISAFKAGDAVKFTFKVEDGQFIITDINLVK